MSVLRSRAKSLGLRQDELAKQLGISLPTIKRWFAGRGVTFESVLMLLETLDMNLSDVEEMASLESTRTFSYTTEQEEFFAARPQYLAYFDHLLAGLSPTAIAHKFCLSNRSTSKYLSALDRLKLIEHWPRDRVKMKTKGEPAWQKNGPLSRSLKDKAVAEFTSSAKESIRLLLHNYTPSDRKRIQDLLSDLSQIAGACDRRGKMLPKESNSYGMLIGFSKFNWGILNTIPNL